MKRRMHVDFIVDIMILDDLHKMRLSLSLYETKITCLRRNEIFDVKLREDGQLPTRLYYPSPITATLQHNRRRIIFQATDGCRVPAGRPGFGLKDTDPSQIDEEALQNVGRMLDSGVLLREEAFSVSFDKYYVRVSF